METIDLLSNRDRDGIENETCKWVSQRVKMLADGFSKEQVQRECWDYCHRQYLGILNIEAIIFRAMQLYAEVIKRSGI